MKEQLQNYLALYRAWQSWNNRSGATAEIRRVAVPDELLEIPAFYRLVEPLGWKSDLSWRDKQRWQRLVFLVDEVTDKSENSLGKALADSRKVSEKRIYQIVRGSSPADIIQLRRLLKQAEPNVSWPKMANQLWYWGTTQKRSLLEDFVLNQKD